MFAMFDIDAALTDYEFEQGMIEKKIETTKYVNIEGMTFTCKLFATTNAKYARVEIYSADRPGLASFGGAIRHYLYTSNKASGPIRGRKVKGSGPRYWNVDYIIDNPFYNAN